MSALTKQEFNIILTTIDCGKCGGTYAINERYREWHQEHGGYWNCPYCNVSWGYGVSENSRLKKELDLERKRKEWAETMAKNERAAREAAEHRERAQKTANTRLKNRIAHGVCPCCNRSFVNLKRHMTAKHPEFTKD